MIIEGMRVSEGEVGGREGCGECMIEKTGWVFAGRRKRLCSACSLVKSWNKAGWM